MPTHGFGDTIADTKMMRPLKPRLPSILKANELITTAIFGTIIPCVTSKCKTTSDDRLNVVKIIEVVTSHNTTMSLNKYCMRY